MQLQTLHMKSHKLGVKFYLAVSGKLGVKPPWSAPNPRTKSQKPQETFEAAVYKNAIANAQSPQRLP